MRKILIAVILVLVLIMTGCSSNQPRNQSAPPQTAPNNNTGTTQQKVFTLDELKKYNGQNGNPAYVAVNGIVYDVTNSSAWRNGLHRQCSNSTYAGADFSELINSSPHGANVINRLPVVGTFKK